MKILIYGAGVIGQIYAARLHEAGHDVTVLARHRTRETLARDGITLVNGALVNGAGPGQPGRVRVKVTGEVGPDSSFELALVTVRRDQVDEVLPALADLQASHVLMMQNNSLELARTGDIVGRDRTLFGFPGVGGYRRDDGVIEYIEIPQQPTTLGRQQGREDIVGAVLGSAGFRRGDDRRYGRVAQDPWCLYRRDVHIDQFLRRRCGQARGRPGASRHDDQVRW